MILRLFLAIPLPDEPLLALSALPRTIRDARFANLRQAHLTLHFLGNTPEGEIPSLVARLNGIKQPPFHARLHGVGTFPSPLDPRVLWVGLDPPRPLRDLHRAIATSLRIPPEPWPFLPHVTLARLGRGSRRDTLAFLSEHATFLTGFFPVNSFCLFRSQLARGGAIHAKIASFFLA